ncbi:MAG: hypothetical protein MUP28_04045 [Candidatus Aminicenantes bacterium]|nr:hypothetical protein [Candidatus Aminicenantes bacterium]
MSGTRSFYASPGYGMTQSNTFEALREKSIFINFGNFQLLQSVQYLQTSCCFLSVAGRSMAAFSVPLHRT